MPAQWLPSLSCYLSVMGSPATVRDGRCESDMRLRGVWGLRLGRTGYTDIESGLGDRRRTRSRGGGPPRRSASRIRVAFIARKCGGDSRASTHACRSCAAAETQPREQTQPLTPPY